MPTRAVIATADRLYIFYDRVTPRFFIVLDPDLRFTCDIMPIYRLRDDRWRDYEGYTHPRLHVLLGNVCRGRYNGKRRRNGADTEFSALLRRGCFDHPFQDVDGIVVEDGKLAGVVEHKNPHEDIPTCQVAVLRRLNQWGLPVHWDVDGETL